MFLCPAARRHRIEQRREEPAVVEGGRAEQERERDAAGIDDHVALAARPAAVGRVPAGRLAPFVAGKETPSSEQRPQSIAFARPSRSSSPRSSRSKTFAVPIAQAAPKSRVTGRTTKSSGHHCRSTGRPANDHC
jgi:hypothetical protein